METKLIKEQTWYERIRETRQVTESSANKYSSYLYRMAKHFGKTNKEFEKLLKTNMKEILFCIDATTLTYPEPTDFPIKLILKKNGQIPSLGMKKVCVAAMLCLIHPKSPRNLDNKPLPGLEKQYEMARSRLQIFRIQEEQFRKANPITKKEKKKMDGVTLEDLNNCFHDYRKELIKLNLNNSHTHLYNPAYQRRLLKKYMCSALYTQYDQDAGPPRNSYRNLIIITEEKYLKLPSHLYEDMNYIVIRSRNHKYFHMGCFKNVKTFGNRIIPINSGLNRAINLYMKLYQPKIYLLENACGGPLSTASMTKLLYKSFAKTGKKISCSLIRKMEHSEHSIKQLNDFEDSTLLAKKCQIMGHSVETASKFYMKPEETNLKI